MNQKHTTIIFVLTLLVLFTSCTNGLLFEFDRPLADPEITSPIVRSFKTESSIIISWEDDASADEYILYSAQDAASPSYSVLYQGTGLSYTDTGRTADQRYLYRLSKVRGSLEFGPSSQVLGLGNDTIQDEYESNDSKTSATSLVYDISANIYYYRSLDLDVEQDYDWYTVVVPPQRTANIVISQGGATSGNSDLEFYLEGSVPQTIVNNSAIPVQNTTFSTKTFYFRISPNPADFVAGVAGGKIVNYTVSLNSII